MSFPGIGAAFTCEALKLDCHVVPGYKSSADAGLAVTRGEMDALYVAESAAINYVRAKQGGRWRRFPENRTSSGPADHFRAAKMNAEQIWAMISSPMSKAGPHRRRAARPSVGTAGPARGDDMRSQPQLIADGEKAERIIEYLDPVSTTRHSRWWAASRPSKAARAGHPRARTVIATRRIPHHQRAAKAAA
jgi:hypothetical protein